MNTELYPDVKTSATAPTLKETATAFWQFLKSPCELEPVQQTSAQVWRPFLQLFVLKLLASLASAGLVYGIVRLTGSDSFASHKLEKMLQQTHIAIALLLVAVVGPILEESFFRAPLRYTRVRLLVAFLAFSFFVLPSFLDILGTSTLVSLILVISTIMLALIFVQSDTLAERMRQVWLLHYPIVFYTFTMAFALVHLANYDNLHMPLALVPLLVVPQFIGGLFWGYTRLRFGLSWAMLAHGLYNALFICLAYLTF